MKSPAFRFYATDYLGSQRVQLLTLEQEGAYIRLLASCWQHGTIPKDPHRAANVVGKGATATLVSSVLPLFSENPLDSSTLIHDRLEAERERQRIWAEKSSIGGQNAAKTRELKKAEKAKGGSSTEPRVVVPSVSVSVSGSGSDSIKKEPDFPEAVDYPTWEEVKAKAEMIGLAEWKAEQWYNESKGCGWKDYRGRQIVDWTAILVNVRTLWEQQGRPMQPPSKVNGSTMKVFPDRQLKELEELLATHPSNPKFIGYNIDAGAKSRDEYKALKHNRDELKRAIATGGTK